MKILIISNVYPSNQRPHAGVFVKNQYEFLEDILREADQGHIDILFMRRTFTNMLGSILKYIIFSFRFIKHLFKVYHIIHIHYFYPLILLAYIYKIFRPTTKIVVTFHGRDITEQIDGGLKQSIFKFIAKKIDYTIAVGKTLRDKHIKEKLNIDADIVLSAGVDRRVFYKEEKIRKIYDILFVG